jgi:hypothetical protein
MLSYKAIKNERQWKAVTGLSEVKFHSLCKFFGSAFEELNEISLPEITSNLNINFLLPTYEDCLFFVLFQLKNGLSYDSLGLLIGTDRGNAQANYEKYLKVLDLALNNLGVMPKRGFKDIAEFEAHFKEEKEIIIDGTEHATQRPKGNDAQKEAYSGKKNSIQIKNL